MKELIADARLESALILTGHELSSVRDMTVVYHVVKKRLLCLVDQVIAQNAVIRTEDMEMGMKKFSASLYVFTPAQLGRLMKEATREKTAKSSRSRVG